jgi:hypothetical protein
MRSCLSGLTFLIGAATCTSSTVTAAEIVYLRGFPLSRQHVVFGSIDAVNANSATINLGYGHGLREGTSLVVVRTVDDAVIPIAGLFVTHTEPDHSYARVEGPFRVREGDFILVHASRLDLWGGHKRIDRFTTIKLGRRVTLNGYNTLDAGGDFIDELSRDDEFHVRPISPGSHDRTIAEAADKVGDSASRVGAVVPAPPNPDATDEASADGTVRVLANFADMARTPDRLIPLIDIDRLERLDPLDRSLQVDEETAPNLRTVLISWCDRTLSIP